jgi:prepilin-type N-terminal cleavage/methylation domain-containing protein
MSIIPPSKKSGFTLIEIVIVLSIASLILVLVFVGVDGAVKANQNEQRRSDAKKVLSVVVSDPKIFDAKIVAAGLCFTNNPPTCGIDVADIVKQALGVTTFEDPTQVRNSGNTQVIPATDTNKAYRVTLRASGATGVAPQIEIRKDAKCKNGNTFEASQGSWAVINILGPFKITGNGTVGQWQVYGTAYCVNS